MTTPTTAPKPPAGSDPATPSRRAARTGPGEGQAFWFYGTRVVLRSPDGAWPIIIEHHLDPGTGSPLHVHHRLDDSFYLLTGQLALRCGNDTFVARASDYVCLPMGVPHALRVIGDEESVLLQTHAEQSFLDFIRAVGIPVEQGRPDLATLDFEAMNAVAAQTGQPVLGPRCPRRRRRRSPAAPQSHADPATGLPALSRLWGIHLTGAGLVGRSPWPPGRWALQ